jgi:hypothetical protein
VQALAGDVGVGPGVVGADVAGGLALAAVGRDLDVVDPGVTGGDEADQDHPPLDPGQVEAEQQHQAEEGAVEQQRQSAPAEDGHRGVEQQVGGGQGARAAQQAAEALKTRLEVSEVDELRHRAVAALAPHHHVVVDVQALADHEGGQQ